MARLDPDLNIVRRETDRLSALLVSTTGLAPNHRKVVAEIVLLRLALLLENQLKVIFSKIASGASYVDGSRPVLLVGQPSMRTAIQAMKTLNRGGKARDLRWNDGREIRENIEHVVDPSDHCVRIMLQYASFLTELRYIRNHIAHRNDGSRANFRKLVRRYYGAFVPGITCGTLLLSPRVSVPSLSQVLIVRARVLIQDLVKN